jgi:uncharacterized protein
MSGSLHTWYSLPDLDRLAARGAVLDGEIELKRLARLNELLHADSGSVRASLRFRQRSGGWLIVEVKYDATLNLTCQRCLEPMTQRVEASIEMGLLEDETLEKHLPEGCEPYVLEDGRLLPAELIEDELIVALPLAPRHARTEQCGRLARDLEVQNMEAAEPFEGRPPTGH